MAEPITIPNGAMIIPINLSSSHKTFTLPTVSTNPGRTIIFKDMFGNAANSTLRLSTLGLDRIERSNVSSMVLSNSYGAWTFMNDGITNWFLTNAYLNSLTIVSQTPPLTLVPAVRYSFLSTNYSGSGPVSNVGSNTAIGSATVSAASYTSASPGFINLTLGAGHYVQAPTVSNIQTVIMIIRVTAGGGNTYLLDARTSLGSGYIYTPETGTDWRSATYYLNTVATAMPTSTLPQAYENQGWIHIAFIRSAFTDDMTFCARVSLNENLGGSCAECMIFTQALTQQQVKDNFNFFASRFGWTPVS